MRIKLLREAGGVGDVVCALGVATAIKRIRPDAHVDFYCLECYRELAGLCPDVDNFVGVPGRVRRSRDEDPDPRRFRYLRDGPADAIVDLFCPGWAHEWSTQGAVIKGRAQLFCERGAEATGLDLVPTPPRIRLTPYDAGRADGWLTGKGADLRRRLIGIQPQANLLARRWPDEKWRELLTMLLAYIPSTRIVCFGTHTETRRFARSISAIEAIFLPYRLAAAVLKRCDVLVGVDSGFYHLAAATRTPAVGIFGVTGGASTSAVYTNSVWIEAGDEERARANTRCVRHCYNMPSAGKESRCDAGPCPAMAEISTGKVLAATLSRLAI